MSTIGELARQHTDLSKEQIAHLGGLVGEWGMLADLSFADLLLHVRSRDGGWIVVAQVRAATGQTIHIADLVGARSGDGERPLLDEAAGTGAVRIGSIGSPSYSYTTSDSARRTSASGRLAV